MSSHHGERSKSRTKVKPILRKLTQSEKNSLDLDRPAAEQDGLGIYEYGAASRSSHDIGFVQTGRRGYHARSTSGTSQFSTATTGSGHRTGSFVHPFQQTPRPYTPPIAASYQNSLRESEVSHANSPTLEEDEDQLRQHPFRSPSNLSNRTTSITGATSSPILTSPLPNLRIQTKPSSSRLALATSHTSLHNSTLSPDIASPTDTMSPVSAIRTSMDKGFRIRSRSEVDTGVRAETIQEARRKFQEKEDAKEEKAAREEIKALEKRQQKEARTYERSARRSSASEHPRSKRARSKSDLTMQEKGGDVFVGRGYDSVPVQTPPFLGEGFEQPRRTNTAKAKTHSAWTKFVMWLKTRWIRLKK
ncbi:uncharacterized protein LY89DRAFT_741539 [Mollisia scopiformis]|uniref:Uncharacterized protein n=1 Tax=Mollisia scopiformis TaxID=149040 RepID=A0A132B8G4_MOLSC|nr:uncharacterized protein LY89DRAFT_741539 [Mollisia scopiformis]KUJ08692.1 hypothetical protein LY89DRAFT_741539 [Mollisia scopiformis]